jgi:hypothetical protein
LYAGKDVIGCAPTGTGKTLSFWIPLLMALEEGITGQMNGDFFTHQYGYSLKNISAVARQPGSTWVNFTELTCVVQLA